MRLRLLIPALLLLCCPAITHATLAFDQPHDGTGALIKSSWFPPDGLDGDTYCWDNFTLANSISLTELRWRGGYEFHPSGAGQAPVQDFEVAIYRSIAGGSQPDLGAGGRLVRYFVGGNAGETPAGSFGGVAMNDYAFTLPSPFPATAGTKYWVRIVASQGSAAPSYAPDWGLASGSGGNGFHFRYITGGMYQNIQKDLAFSLLGAAGPAVTIDAVASPAGAGSVSGAGSYPVGSLATLIATPNAGWGFTQWTEGAASVSTNATYSFTASSNRSLVAHFVNAWNVQTAAYPVYAGAVTGAGTYNDGATVTLTATPARGFVFTGWSNGGTTESLSFAASADVILTAFFTSAPDCATFDFDSGPVHTSLPLTLSANGIDATFQGGYSIQPVGSVGIAPLGFSGNYLFPNSVFPSDLLMSFSGPLTELSILCAPDEIACDNSATLKITGFLSGVEVGSSTATAPVPGTYPPVTLTLAPPTPFDSVVVHWQSAGTRCTDYGPIFFADNVTVTRVPPATAVEPPLAPRTLRLLSPTPNPARTSVELQFELPRSGDVHVEVFDVAGRRVRDLLRDRLPAGTHGVAWDGGDDSGLRRGSGLYLVRLSTAEGSATRRLVLVR